MLLRRRTPLAAQTKLAYLRPCFSRMLKNNFYHVAQHYMQINYIHRDVERTYPCVLNMFEIRYIPKKIIIRKTRLCDILQYFTAAKKINFR